MAEIQSNLQVLRMASRPPSQPRRLQIYCLKTKRTVSSDPGIKQTVPTKSSLDFPYIGKPENQGPLGEASGPGEAPGYQSFPPHHNPNLSKGLLSLPTS